MSAENLSLNKKYIEFLYREYKKDERYDARNNLEDGGRVFIRLQDIVDKKIAPNIEEARNEILKIVRKLFTTVVASGEGMGTIAYHYYLYKNLGFDYISIYFNERIDGSDILILEKDDE